MRDLQMLQQVMAISRDGIAQKQAWQHHKRHLAAAVTG
jgi:hypothetical protein